MGLITLKTRPLSREIQSFRDDRLFIVACDDTYAPKQYFDFFRIPRIQVHVVSTHDGSSSAEHVLGRLLEYDHEDDDERWMLLDTDHYATGRHRKSFFNALSEARRHGVNVAISKPCFEFWLLLHHLDEDSVPPLAVCRDVERQIRKVVGRYNKTRLIETDFPLANVPVACRRAQTIDDSIGDAEVPDGSTTRVYRLWKSITSKALASQLPSELLDLLNQE